MTDRIFNNISRLEYNGNVPFFRFAPLDGIPFVRHCYSTRLGGVSEGIYKSMNLSFERGDNPEHVRENLRLLGEAAGFDYRNIVCPNQWHTNNVRAVDKSFCGEGITRPRTTEEIDAQITNVPGVVLMAFGIDCPTLFLVDRQRKAIGLAHSGWKGTLNNIASDTIWAMKNRFGSDFSNITAVIGPSICGDCYEVGEDVASLFREKYPDCEEGLNVLNPGKSEGKYYLDLWNACIRNLLGAGVLKENIYVSGVCTMSNPDILFSHRRDGLNRGNMAGFLEIVE